MNTIHARTALLPGGWAQDVAVTVEGGRIAAVRAGVPGSRLGPSFGPVVDCLLPAPVNLHSHAFQRAMAGLTEARGPGADSFWTWRDLMYRFLDRLTPEDVQAIAAMVMIEMAEAGYAAVAEFHYLHHAPGGAAYDNPAEMAARIVAAAEVTGLGLTLLPVLYQRGGCDGRALQGGQLRFGCDEGRFLGLWSAAKAAVKGLAADAGIGVAPHSLRAVGAEGLVLAESLRGPIHIHAAEQMAEVEEVLAATGRRPVEFLLDRGLSDRWCLIHATQMEPQETLGMAQAGAVAGLCPITESSLGDGIFDGVRFLGAGGVFGVGSDSNIRISLSEELRTLEYSQRLAGKGRAMLADHRSTGRVLLEGAAQGGAQAAGRASGAIAPGMWADLVALDLSGPDLEGLRGDTILDTWIFAGDDRAVVDLWSAGRHIVRGGRHVAREGIVADYRSVMRRLREAM